MRKWKEKWQLQNDLYSLISAVSSPFEPKFILLESVGCVLHRNIRDAALRHIYTEICTKIASNAFLHFFDEKHDFPKNAAMIRLQ